MKLPAVLLSIGFLITACSGPPALSTLTLTYVGVFEHAEGAEDPLGCFCTEGGYLNTCGGQRIALCFEGVAPPGSCQNLEVKGKYREGVADTPPGSPCPEGVFQYLLVEEWRCLN